MQILIVDDDPTSAKLLFSFLKNWISEMLINMNFLEFKDGAACLHQFFGVHPGVHGNSGRKISQTIVLRFYLLLNFPKPLFYKQPNIIEARPVSSSCGVPHS